MKLNQQQKENWEIHKYVEIEQPVVQKKKIKREVRKYQDKWKQNYNLLTHMRYSQSSTKRKIYSNKYLHYQRKKFGNKLTLHLKELEFD